MELEWSLTLLPLSKFIFIETLFREGSVWAVAGVLCRRGAAGGGRAPNKDVLQQLFWYFWQTDYMHLIWMSDRPHTDIFLPSINENSRLSCHVLVIKGIGLSRHHLVIIIKKVRQRNDFVIVIADENINWDAPDPTLL